MMRLPSQAPVTDVLRQKAPMAQPAVQPQMPLGGPQSPQAPMGGSTMAPAPAPHLRPTQAPVGRPGLVGAAPQIMSRGGKGAPKPSSFAGRR